VADYCIIGIVNNVRGNLHKSELTFITGG